MTQRIRTGARRAVVVTLMLAGLAAGPAMGDPAGPRWPAAAHGGSPRLLAFSLTRQPPPPDSLVFLQEVQRQSGIAHAPGDPPKRIGGFFSVAPVVGFDPNINNGIPGAEIALGGVTFTVTPDSRAKSTVTAGAELRAGASWSLSPGHVFSVSGHMQRQKGLKYPILSDDAQMRACLSAASPHWVWVDACLGGLYQKKGTDVREGFATVAVTGMVSSRFADHEIRAEVRRSRRADYARTSGSLTVLSAVPGLGVLGLQIGGGDWVDRYDTVQRSAALWLSRPVAGRKTTLRLDLAETGGSKVFRMARADRAHAVSVTRDLRKGVDLTVGLRRVTSSIDAYAQDSGFVGLSFDGLRF